jgi:hypothetical protein
VDDIVRYRAAAVAASRVDVLSYNLPWVLDRYPYAAARRSAYDRWRTGHHWLTKEKPAEAVGSEAGNAELWLQLMSDWRSLFAPEGKAYASLNKTLDAAPGGVTPGLLCNLQRVRLERPVSDRLELMTIGAGAECRHRHHDRVFAHARRDEILRAIRVVGEGRSAAIARQVPGYQAELLSHRSTRDVVSFVRYLSDFYHCYLCVFTYR